MRDHGHFTVLGISEIGNDYWRVENTDGQDLIVKMGYDGVSEDESMNGMINLLWQPTNQTTNPREFRVSLAFFLQQFLTIKCLWGGKYEDLTESIIEEAAKYQITWFKRSSTMAMDIRGKSISLPPSIASYVYTR